MNENKKGQEQFLWDFFEMNPVAIIRLDMQCHIVDANRIARLLFSGVDATTAQHPLLSNLETMTNALFSGNMAVFKREVSYNNNIYEQTVFRTTADYLYSYIEDITERKQFEKKLADMSRLDVLTGLPNRIALLDAMTYGFSRASRHQSSLALLYMDIDQFKKINDSLGHDVGDLLIQEVAKRLKATKRKGDLVARMGGDEFVIFLEQINQPYNAAIIARSIIHSLKAPIFIHQHELFISCSIGIAIYSGRKEKITIDALIQHADMAMYKAKKLGRDQYQFYTDELNFKAQRYIVVENKLHHTLININELFLHYQLIYDAQTQVPVGMEVLLRWRNPELGDIVPEEIIPVAESSGLMFDLGKWVIKTAFQEYKQLIEHNQNTQPALTLAINFSAQQFLNPIIYDTLKLLIDTYQIPPKNLIIEITESALMINIEKTKKILDKIVALGIKVAIDDFGTGYSSFIYLQQLPIHILKIDKNFIRNIFSQTSSNSIVKTAIMLAKQLKLEIIAEGVETKEQYEWLKKEGCDIIQGFYFSKPATMEDVVAKICR